MYMCIGLFKNRYNNRIVSITRGCNETINVFCMFIQQSYAVNMCKFDVSS